MRDFLVNRKTQPGCWMKRLYCPSRHQGADDSGPTEGMEPDVEDYSGFRKASRAVSAGTAEAGTKSLSGVNSPAAGLGRADSIAAPMGRAGDSWLGHSLNAG